MSFTQPELVNEHLEQMLSVQYGGFNVRARGGFGLTRYDDYFSRERYVAPRVLIKNIPQLNDGTVLDLGCGTGRLVQEMFHQNVIPHTIDGIDASIGMLKIAREKPYNRLILADITQINQTFEHLRSNYSVLVSSGVFGHILSAEKSAQTIENYAKFMAPKSTIGLTLGNTYEESAQKPTSDVLDKLEPVFAKHGFNDVRAFIDVGHTESDIREGGKIVTWPKNYVYVIARRN